MMDFLNRIHELSRLQALVRKRQGGFVVLFGRRRVGKSRLLVEWVKQNNGVYTVADQSSPDQQRQHIANAIAQKLSGFADVVYPDWTSLFRRLSAEASSRKWRGPFVLDEFPYLVLSSPELPSVMQRWIDGDARDAKLVTAIAGSSQRMMQGLVLDGNAPLYGRARELFHLPPLSIEYLRPALGLRETVAMLEFYVAWGGIPRYWELAADVDGGLAQRVDTLVLNPMGVLHREPDRLLLEETPPAIEVRPLLDAIGLGANRVSEIAARIGRPATSLSRGLDRLIGMGFIERQVPFGELEKKSKRSIYVLADPFLRLWFRVVAPNRGFLATASEAERLRLLEKSWPYLVGFAWEDLCRRRIATFETALSAEMLGSAKGERNRTVKWGSASRWWRGNEPEWDIVAESLDGKYLICGECKWMDGQVTAAQLKPIAAAVAAKRIPLLASRYAKHTIVRALFVPRINRIDAIDGVRIVDSTQLFANHNVDD